MLPPFCSRRQRDNKDLEERIFEMTDRKLWLFTGLGILMSIAFLDPSNLEADLHASVMVGDTMRWLLL
ncbi:hypothetical protein PR202_gn00759 [Eleusine coracana subsp. coracana]|uniref:Uncharacterized protein n=1 Tax=Eleusine coracana subsp. coracana TaxID=191504 RepID=A0AAV5G3T7_ELECO|nr:hypothetical protein PR202_gn00759 [Eleusine coracana subsp. coracana]